MNSSHILISFETALQDLTTLITTMDNDVIAMVKQIGEAI